MTVLRRIATCNVSSLEWSSTARAHSPNTAVSGGTAYRSEAPTRRCYDRATWRVVSRSTFQQRSLKMRLLQSNTAIVFALTCLSAPSAFAGGSVEPVTPDAIQQIVTGQPNQECGSETAPNTPGRAATAQGSAFNPSGTAGSVYAGEQPQNTINNATVSQYDAACFRQPK